MNELDPNLHSQINILCQKGDEYLEDDHFIEAISAFQKALELIPKPITDWEASTWVLTALGETYFFSAQYGKATSTLQDAMHCPGAIGNPLIHLRLGQAHFEMNQIDKSKDELARAYMGGGEEIFDGEDPKYLSLVKQHLRYS